MEPFLVTNGRKEGNMYAKAIIMSLMVAVGGSIGVLHSPGISGEKQVLAELYEKSIVQRIVKCENQAEILYASKSVTLWNYADLQIRKAQFFETEKDMLIDIMIKNRIEPKRYKIEHFLDNQFYKSLTK